MLPTKGSPNTTTENSLRISESFYSIQGEGVTSGYPAYFIRLQGCNLMCGGKDGSLMKEGKATWWCDTEYVWRKGKKTDIEVLIDDWKKNTIPWEEQGGIAILHIDTSETIYKLKESLNEAI